MKELCISEILSATDGILISGDEKSIVESVSINSKKVKKGALFVPIIGERINGHSFIEEAFAAGAVATLTSENVKINPNRVYIKVDDTKKALQKLAGYYRQKFDIPVVGVTGSVGKTSTKEMIFNVLSEKFKVHKTEANLNGQIGLPLTLFGIEPWHDVAVVEMGISEFNEMENLAEIAKPNFAVISNIGVTHIENLQSKENIFLEKLKITKYLKKSDFLFINGDDEILSKMSKDDYKFKIISFGIKNRCNFIAKDIIYKEKETIFKVLAGELCQEFKIPTIGKHNVYNALIAIALGFFMNLDTKQIQNGLLKFKNLSMRQSIYYLRDNITLIDDSYNANPDSMRSALQVLTQVAKNKRKIAVLADMLELGDLSEKSHFDIGTFVAKLKIDVLITVGDLSRHISKGTYSLNKDITNYLFKNNKEAIDCLKNLIRQGDCILVKGSRGMHMDEISKEIMLSFK